MCASRQGLRGVEVDARRGGNTTVLAYLAATNDRSLVITKPLDFSRPPGKASGSHRVLSEFPCRDFMAAAAAVTVHGLFTFTQSAWAMRCISNTSGLRV
jgi:hypothetical protein